MRVNIYYGGRGLIEDPTIYVMNKLTEVLEEIRVEVKRYNLYEEKKSLSLLPKTLKEADGVILAVSVEWLGIGGLMQQFLDDCWLYGDKQKISSLYMLPVVMASTYGERDAEVMLIKAWEMLGGIPCDGLCAYVDNNVEFETNADYAQIIEKRAELLYRTIKQKQKSFPTSNNAVKESVLRSTALELTPQESEQLSMYVSDDKYVRKQKEDIEELTQKFKEMLGTTDLDKSKEKEFINELKNKFHPVENFIASYAITFTDTQETLIIEVAGDNLNCYYGDKEEADVIARTTKMIMNKMMYGATTFQGAFMTGDLTAKGNFKTLRMFDQVFK